MMEIFEPTPDDCGRVLRSPNGTEYWVSSRNFYDLQSDEERDACALVEMRERSREDGLDALRYSLTWLRSRPLVTNVSDFLKVTGS